MSVFIWQAQRTLPDAVYVLQKSDNRFSGVARRVFPSYLMKPCARLRIRVPTAMAPAGGSIWVDP